MSDWKDRLVPRDDLRCPTCGAAFPEQRLQQDLGEPDRTRSLNPRTAIVKAPPVFIVCYSGHRWTIDGVQVVAPDSALGDPTADEVSIALGRYLGPA